MNLKNIILTLSSKLIYLKLLAIHHNIIEEIKKNSESLNLTKLINLNKSDLNQSGASASNHRSLKSVRTGKVSEIARDLLGIGDLELADINQNMSEDYYKVLNRLDEEENALIIVKKEKEIKIKGAVHVIQGKHTASNLVQILQVS
ncbi:7279_t:CDS:2, partial [Racocetra fulgida]